MYTSIGDLQMAWGTSNLRSHQVNYLEQFGKTPLTLKRNNVRSLMETKEVLLKSGCLAKFNSKRWMLQDQRNRRESFFRWSEQRQPHLQFALLQKLQQYGFLQSCQIP